ncbi:DUF6343 family protein [Modestobacter sp. SYSU DS0290]
MSEPRRDRTRTDYEQGLPDHHDPTAGVGGAAPAQSALTLRLVLAAFGLVVCTAFGILMLNIDDVPVAFPIVLFVLAAVALVDLVVVARRKLRGEPG